jgi:four helix bundle protein
MLERTRSFAVRIIRLVAALPKGRTGDVLGRQVLKSGTAIGANYCEGLRASTRRHFVTTLEIAQREADETLYWLDLIAEAELVKSERLKGIRKECDELLCILTATIRTAKRRATVKNQKS